MSDHPTSSAIALQSPKIPHNIRFVHLQDVDKLRQSCWEQFSITHCRERIKQILRAKKQGRGYGIVVETHTESDIIGFGQTIKMAKCAEISNLIVAEEFRGQGIGTAMIQYLIGLLRDKQVDCVEIGVAKSNPRALNLYLQLGFSFAYELMLNLGKGREPVAYLSLTIPQNAS